jgi:hypothetical protein
VDPVDPDSDPDPEHWSYGKDPDLEIRSDSLNKRIRIISYAKFILLSVPVGCKDTKQE